MKTGSEIRALRAEHSKMRERDFAEQFGISEAQLVAAHVGQGVTPVGAHPDLIVPAAARLGEVMALTRNASCVHEKVGRYENYHPGPHAGMVLTKEIDLRIFPSQWVHGFAVEKETEAGVQRSLQVFDAAGDAIHKVHLRDGSDLEAWDAVKTELALPEAADTLEVKERAPVEAAKLREDKAELLRVEWKKLTDTHQFLRLCSKLKMNRLGAYRIAGAPFVRPLVPAAVDAMLEGVRDAGIDFMFFCGNRGCIQIHNGPVKNLRKMGPWQNILDPGFDMHLRSDHVAEVWAVEKPTQRGPALSLEAFDAEGGLIFQAFPQPKEDNDTRAEWRVIMDGLETLEGAAA